jgi:hypothetical protein
VALPKGDIQLEHREELVWLLPLTVLAIALYALAAAAGVGFGIPTAQIVADYGRMALNMLPLLFLFLLIGVAARAMLFGGDSPLRALTAPFLAHVRSPLLAISALTPLVLMPILIACFSVLKMAMPRIAPFAWDDSFAALDRALFLGHQPWMLTHALFGGARATALIDLIYTLWIPIFFTAILGFALLAPRVLRARFFLAFGMSWLLLGVVGAYATASAGPCFSGLLGLASAPDYAGLIQRLHALSPAHEMLGAVEWQGVLWKAHASNDYGVGMGISAMPSMHNAISVLYALALAKVSRRASIAGWLFTAMIFIGSIHLGWHYASDGIVAGLAMAGIWWGAGRYLDRMGYTAAASVPLTEPSPERPALA